VDPKRLGDDLVVKIRPDFSRGFADLWEVRDALVAICQELDHIYVLGNAGAPWGGAARTWIKLIDSQDSEL